MGRKNSTKKRKALEKKSLQQNDQQRNNRIIKIKTKEKTVPCDYHKVGLCTKGKLCKFSHDFQPQYQDDTLCKYNLVGACQNKPCYFSHDTSKFPCKFLFVSGKCEKGSWCLFSHQLFQEEKKLKEFINDNQEALQDHLKNNIIISTTYYALQNNLIQEKEEEPQIPDFFKEGINENKQEEVKMIKLINPLTNNSINSKF